MEKENGLRMVHQTHFLAPAMPWHTEDHKFGEASPEPEAVEEDKGERQGDSDGDVPDASGGVPACAPRSSLPGTVFFVETGNCYYCGADGVYGYKGNIYCLTCWNNTEVG